MNVIARCLVAAPLCAALIAPVGQAGAADPPTKGQGASRVNELVSVGAGLKEARAALLPASPAAESRQKVGDRPAQVAAPSANAPIDPGLYDSRLNDYRLERESCCAPLDE